MTNNSDVIRMPGTKSLVSVYVDPDRSLMSYEALGMLLYMSSLPEDSEITPADLQSPGYGRDKVLKTLGILIDNGYVTRTQMRNEDNTFGPMVYQLHEIPVDVLEPRPKIQGTDTPLPGIQGTASRDLYNNINIDQEEKEREREKDRLELLERAKALSPNSKPVRAEPLQKPLFDEGWYRDSLGKTDLPEPKRRSRSGDVEPVTALERVVIGQCAPAVWLKEAMVETLNKPVKVYNPKTKEHLEHSANELYDLYESYRSWVNMHVIPDMSKRAGKYGLSRTTFISGLLDVRRYSSFLKTYVSKEELFSEEIEVDWS